MQSEKFTKSEKKRKEELKFNSKVTVSTLKKKTFLHFCFFR